MNQTFIDSNTLASAVALAFPLGIIFGILIGKLK
jgi:hypothetical protein